MPALAKPLCRCGSQPLPGLVLLPAVVSTEKLLRHSERLLGGANQAMRFGRLPCWARAAARCAPPGFRKAYDQLIAARTLRVG